MHVNPLLDKKLVEETLKTVLDRVKPEARDVEYRFLGTGAALLHGVALPAGDIDILVKERRGVNVFSIALACFDCLIAPTFLEDMRQYYTEFRVNGVEVGISTVEIETDVDWIETYGSGPWTHYVFLPCGPRLVPTVKLELRLITELYRNRPERYELIIEFLEKKWFDESLLKRGIKGLPEDLQSKVSGRLGLR
jgi:hypothetical protein